MNKRKLIWIAAAVVVLVAGAAYYMLRSRAPETTYREATVSRDRIAISILATGTVQPENRLEIKPPVAGRVEEVLVKEGEVVKRGQVIAWMSSTERAALLDAARSEGPEEVKRWERDYRPTPVIAPIDGTIILRNVESGQTFAATDALFTMSDRLTVKAQVDETDIGQVKVGQDAIIVLDAFPGREIPARVGLVAFDATTVNNVTTYVVDVLPRETPDFMKSGMTANVTFQVEVRDDVLVVPTRALSTAGGETNALVRGARGEPVPRTVKTGLSDGRMTEVQDGLKEGEIVLIEEISATGKVQATSPFSPMRGRGTGRRSSGGR